MAKITLQGTPVNTVGRLPEIGTVAPDFYATTSDLTDIDLKKFRGKKVILNIFPSLDTPTCASSVRKFNETISRFKNMVVLCISADLPFAQQRFCAVENLHNVIPLSIFRHTEFGKDYGVTLMDGKLKGLLSRAVIVLDEQGRVIYTQQVEKLEDEPDYHAVFNAI